MCNAVMQLDIACASPEPVAVFDQFDSVSLSSLANIVSSMKPTNCPLDVIPARLLAEVFSSLGSSLLVLINSVSAQDLSQLLLNMP